MVLIPADSFRELMSLQCSSVSVVSGSAPDGTFVGFTATSVQGVSDNPPTVSFSVSSGGARSSVWSTLEFVGVSLLSDGAEELARRFATRGGERFVSGDYFVDTEFNVPLICNAVFNLVGRVAGEHQVGQSRVYYLEVVSALARGRHAPLLYLQRRFCSISL
jgi:flavin reductase (DIM6/NTAB) family NADH-FMN oxidoreductase RutF